ncbi:MAG TPA: DUF6531 domain-containing protein, partial [Solirubrobacterales bacterium]|nr:DUF6531 domain-containing protein [Solirubrobacterales bacterium]
MALLALLLFFCTSVPAFALADSGEPPLADGAPDPTPDLAAIEREDREHTEWLSSPEAANQREVTRTAYTELSAGEAQALLVGSFPEQLEELNADPARFLSELEIEKPLGAFGARIAVGEGETAIIESAVPIESDLGGEGREPVDLALERSGDHFAPRNPLSRIELPGSAAQSIELEGGVAVGLPASGNSVAEPLGDKNLFYPETDTATDTLVAPIAGGVEVFEQLRSPESPEEFRFPIALPDGATLRSGESNDAEIVSASGEGILEIPPPAAFDAQGTLVPVTMRVEGDTLVIGVAHRSQDVAYPVLLDPRYNNGYESPPFNGWAPVKNADYSLAQSPSSLAAISKGSNVTYPAYTWGQWEYSAPGETAYIENATFSSISFIPHACQTPQPHGYLGIYNVLSGAYSSIGVYATGESYSPGFLAGGGGYGTRKAIVGIGTGATSSKLSCAHELYVGGVTVQENDPEAPTITTASGVPSGWFDPAAAGNAWIVATDAGFGVDLISIFDGKVTSEDHVGCTGMSGSRCPRDRGWSIAPPYAEGERTLKVAAEDPTGKVGEWSTTTKVDFTKPEVDLGGQLAVVTEESGLEENKEQKAKDSKLKLPVYNLHIKAIDGNEKGTPQEKQSGVKNIEVLLDGVKQQVPWNAQACPQSSCKMEADFQLKLVGVAAGEHTLKVAATDQLDHARPREIEFEYIPATGIKDEYVMQHFPLPDGKGNEAEEESPVRPELAVNVTNGNLVYRQQDVEVSGPRVSLELERFYNSQLPEADNTEWGDGWTLAQTPTLEPEGAGAPPSEASMVASSGALESAVPLPTEPGGSHFDSKLQAVVTRDPGGGYQVADESGETDTALTFDEAGRVTELGTSGSAKIDYEYEAGHLAEIAVDDPASTNLLPGEVKEPVDPPIYQSALATTGTAGGQLKRPADVALDAKGNLWVADKINYRVQEFGPAGEFIR